MQQAVNIMIERMARIGVASNVTLDDIEQARSVVSGE
jgi:fructose-specific phosphotransferase system component IIB